MKPPHILQLDYEYNKNLNSLSNAILVGLSQSAKTTATFLHGDDNLIKEKVFPFPESVHHHAFHFTSKSLKGLQRRKQAKKIAQYCQQNNVDIIISHRFKAFHLLGLVARKIPFKKKITVIHGTNMFDKFYRKLLARWLLPSFTIVAVSNAIKKDILQSIPSVKPEQIKVIYNAIDAKAVEAAQLSKQDAREALNLPENAFIFGNIGRLVKAKAQSHLIDAFKAANVPNAHLVIMGKGYLKTQLREQIERLGLTDRVHLLGEVIDAYKYTAAFDTFVLSSIHESFGVVLLEAMAAHVPIIGSNTEGIPEVLGELGHLYPTQDTNALTGAMETFYNMPEIERKQMGQQLNQHLHTHFDIQRYHEDYRQLCCVVGAS